MPPFSPSEREQLEQKRLQLRALGEISAALAGARELEATLEVITRVTSDVMSVASCSIYLSAAGRLVLKATTGLAKEAIGIASLGAGEGLTGWAVTNGSPIAASDVRADPRFKLLPETREEGLRSLLAVPLTVQGRAIGAMNVQTREPHEFTADEVELLALIANLAAGALEKASLYDRMREQIRDLEALLEVSRAVISPIYLDEMLGVVAEMGARVMGARAVTLHLRDEASGRLELRAAHQAPGAGGPFSGAGLGRGIVEEVAEQSRPIVVPDLRLDRPPTEAEGLVSLLSVPLVVRGRTVGVFSCFTDAPHEFTAKEVDLFSMLANQTALASENAQLVINTAVVREMHHRVKNNLQTVAMLLRLQLGTAPDAQVKSILAGAIARILSIAAVHESLSDQGLKLVDVQGVLERVARSVADTMLAPGAGIAIEVQADRLPLSSRAATSLALVVSELVQNAIKHAFPGRTQGRVTIALRAGREEHELVVADDGVGELRPAPPSSPPRRGIGLEIVETLVDSDLAGRFELTSSPSGTRAVIRFPAAAGDGAGT